MSRIIWKGAIVFGLVHIPIALKPASRSQNLDFDWLDKRDMSPVGYQRFNKSTGKLIDSEYIVKGYQYSKGEYVLLSDEDFRRANVDATQTIEILAFVERTAVPGYFFETPYFLEPERRAEKGYALLRETLRRSDRVGLARVVLHSKQHLAALLVEDDFLMLNTMRFANEILPSSDISVPSAKEVKLTARELEMAEKLVADMATDWHPEEFADTYREDLLRRIDEKIAAGETQVLTEPGQEKAPRQTAQVIDLVALLQKSIRNKTRSAASKAAGRGAVKKRATKVAATSPAAKSPPARKARIAAKKVASRRRA